MKKRILLTCIALCSAMLGAYAQRSYTFNATALNVDGLPKKISFVEINPDGKEEAGATELCGILANSGWDIVGFSEDFNFHSYLVGDPAKKYYAFGKHGGEITANAILSRAETDGLGFACANRFSFSGGTRVAWEGFNGTTDQGADGLITKGFRVYNVTLATGVVVDVYVLHMEAEDGEKDNAVRDHQLGELATYIKKNHNNRPVIILGDTNCRYTRDQLKKNFIDVINADSRFTIKDAWVELMWGGTYPEHGAGALMTDAYGMQKGEVVDKVFYINTTESNLTLKANTYLHDASVTASDHKPVVVNFTLTDPNSKAPTATEKEDNWTLEEAAATFTKPTWEGEKVVSGTTYYLMNVGTGECIRTGGAYYTQAVAGNAALKITPTTSNGGSTWVLSTYRGCSLGTGGDAYADQSGEWYLEQVSGTAYQYRLKNTGGTYLTATTEEAHHPVRNLAGNANDENQKWIFLTDTRIRTEMNKANADYPFNFTALLKSADFDVIEFEDGWTAEGWTGFNQSSGPFKASGHNWGWDALAYSAYAYANQAAAATMSQSLGTLPNGIYDISFTGFYRSQKSSDDETLSAAVKFGNTSISVKQNKNVTIGDLGGAEQYFRVTNNTYRTNKQTTLSSSSSITLQVTKPKSSSSGWICVDNFRLLYYGTSAEAVDPYKEYKDQVRIKVNETYTKVIKLNAAGQAAYDITAVTSRYNNNQITTKEAADALCTMVDKAYANAYAAHRAYIVEHAYDNLGADGDVSVVIENPSFETGDLTGWTVFKNGNDTRVANDLNAVGMDGKYLFNSWADGNYDCGIICQDIKGLRNGYYTLQAMVTSSADRKVYIVGNNRYVGTFSPNGAGTFVNLSLDFLVENGSAQIGAVGGNKDNDFYYKQGIFYKVDHFRLAYKGSVGEGRVKIALADAKAKAASLNPTSKAQFEKAVAKYENATISGDGKTEETAIYNALKTAIGTQPYAETDMTWLITNPSFETGDWTGWTKPTAWDATVFHATDKNATNNGEGQYVVNVWNDQPGIENSGINQPTYQALTGLPNGRYRLTADVATDSEVWDGEKNVPTNYQLCVYATVGSNTKNGVVSPINNQTFVKASVEFDVTDATATIGAVGLRNGAFDKDGGNWYKCDNFRLTYLGHDLTLTETRNADTIDDWYTKVDVTRSIKADKWSTFVVPFDMTIPEGWEVKALIGSEMNGDNITLQFGDATSIEAGVAYMVRVGSDVSSLPTAENVLVSTELNNPSTNDVEFVGVYEAGKIPAGAFFISNNVFYQAADNTNTIKAFRAYFTTKIDARALNYRIDGEEDATGIDREIGNVTVVGIYTLGGVRIDDMQDGVNILQMSDGSVIKVVIK